MMELLHNSSLKNNETFEEQDFFKLNPVDSNESFGGYPIFIIDNRKVLVEIINDANTTRMRISHIFDYDISNQKADTDWLM